MRTFLMDLLGVATFVGAMAVAYVVVCLLTLGKIVGPAQLGAALK